MMRDVIQQKCYSDGTVIETMYDGSVLVTKPNGENCVGKKLSEQKLSSLLDKITKEAASVTKISTLVTKPSTIDLTNV
ncbi:MAG: hypothetical protein LBG48_02440 [Rickettsiales bacterium]|jgi:hypothetical protein|nr:hypothetical protein [Rickettsiales bacterium]